MPNEKLIYRATKLAGHLPFMREKVIAWQMDRLPHPFYLRAGTSDAQTFRQIFIYNEYRLPLARIPEVIVDAGANIGLATLYFASLYPSARIIALEPEASNFALLRRNVAAYPNIEPVCAALWNECTTLQLSDPGFGHWGFQARQGEGSNPVDAFTVDRLMADRDLSHIDYLKIDIEGGELEVFKERPDWVDKVGMMVVELHDRDRPGCSDAFARSTADFADRQVLGENSIVARPGWINTGVNPA